MKITYYLEVLSSWCTWAEPTWAEIKSRYASHAEFQWKIALMEPGDFPTSKSQCEWYYRRSGTITRSPIMLNSGWFEPERKGVYHAPNRVAEAGKIFGITDDRLRLALAKASLREGRKLGEINAAVAVAAQATGLDADQLREKADSPEIMARLKASTAEFHAMGVTQRPTFVIENAIGDKAVISGLITVSPLIATIEAMFSDEAAYAAYAAHHGKPPAI